MKGVVTKHARRHPATRWAPFLLVALAVAGCGNDDGNGSGPLDSGGAEVKAYRQGLEPIIVAVNEIEMDVQESAVGSSGQATAANLAAAFQRLRPRLMQAHEAFQRLRAPAQMAELHDRIGDLIRLRLEAFDALLEGFGREDETLYAVAEERLSQANELIPALNEQLVEIDLDLAASGTAIGKLLMGITLPHFAGQAAVDDELGTGDETGLVRGQVDRSVGHVPGITPLVDRRLLVAALERLLDTVAVGIGDGQGNHRGGHQSGQDAVGADVEVGVLHGHRLGQLQDRTFRGAVGDVGHAQVADADDRADVDDGAGLLPFHVG